MIKSGCNVDFQCCRANDPNFGGKITLPDGQKITMIFEDNLWRLPMWTPVKARLSIAASKPKSLISSNNPYAALAALTEDDDVQCNANFVMNANMTIDERIQVVHNSYAHPCNHTLSSIYTH